MAPYMTEHRNQLRTTRSFSTVSLTIHLNLTMLLLRSHVPWCLSHNLPPPLLSVLALPRDNPQSFLLGHIPDLDEFLDCQDLSGHVGGERMEHGPMQLLAQTERLERSRGLFRETDRGSFERDEEMRRVRRGRCGSGVGCRDKIGR
jgi:hypothetical protein